MQITIHAKGKGANNLSYFFGKHPDNPFIRETKYGVVECKFLKYEENEAKVYFTFLPNGLSLIKESDYKNLEDYINDREFSLSSIFLTNIRSSIGYVLSGGKEGIEEPLSYSVSLSPISTKLPDHAIEELFAPLGYQVIISKIESDYEFEINSGRVIDLQIEKEIDIVSLFKQIFVLIPVIDNYKHYQIDQNDADKLLRYGDGWLEHHPKKNLITNRFVGYKKSLANEVIQILDQKEQNQDDVVEVKTEPETKTPLGKLRYSAFSDKIRELDVSSVVDMGAGEGRLLELFVQNENLEEIFACEPTLRGIEKMKRLTEILHRKKKVKVEPTILQSSLFYQDERLVGKDALVLCEVIEHIEIERIDDVLSNLLSFYQPTYLIFSTPNYEYNDVYGLEGKFRHNDHRFEMTRNEFFDFANKHAIEQNYSLEIIGIGEEHETLGFPTQMAILKKN